MAERLDLLILGATGFTGLHCIPYVHKLSKENGRKLTWGIAGRSEEKLKGVLEKVGKQIGEDLKSIPIVTANIDDAESLQKMAKRAKVVLNCCGPYRYLGEAVVKACIEAGTHHVDVSGEPEYMERVQVEQNEAAKEKGVYVVSACGFDSIPTDLGIVFTEQQFEGTLNSITTYLEGWEEGEPVPGPSINFGTWATAVDSIAHEANLKAIRSKLFSTKLPKFEPKLQIKNLPHKSEVVKDAWVVPFPGSDRSVARRTQTYFYEVEDKRPVQVGTYFVVRSFWSLILLIIFGTLFSILAKFSFGRKLLLKYPELFSGGFFGKDLPPEEKIEKTHFRVTLYGEGWKEKLANKDDQYAKPCDRSILAKVQGKNPGYGATCLCLVMAGIIILTETDKLAGNGKGGVFPPGAAFAHTSMIKQLNENGLTFEVLEQKNL